MTSHVRDRRQQPWKVYGLGPLRRRLLLQVKTTLTAIVIAPLKYIARQTAAGTFGATEHLEMRPTDAAIAI